MKPVMHIGFDFVVRNLPPPTIGYDFDSKCTVSHSPDAVLLPKSFVWLLCLLRQVGVEVGAQLNNGK